MEQKPLEKNTKSSQNNKNLDLLKNTIIEREQKKKEIKARSDLPTKEELKVLPAFLEGVQKSIESERYDISNPKAVIDRTRTLKLLRDLQEAIDILEQAHIWDTLQGERENNPTMDNVMSTLFAQQKSHKSEVGE